ncbi:MAG: hypothetical protein NT154_11090 [Verrucomicrobia bacterium]|nr:hypothetical protein [Verrucomicrobiota bacterium]
MKRFSVIVALLLAWTGALADGPDDQYYGIYMLIQQADKLNSDERLGEALPKYIEALKALQQFKKGNPTWNPEVVTFRSNYLATTITALSARLPAPVTPIVGGPGATPVPAPGGISPAQPAKAAPRDWERQLAGLTDQVRQLQADKGTLEAKLKESLSVQPAAADPRELARAEEKLRELQKENDLLKLSLDLGKAKSVAGSDTNAWAKEKAALEEKLNKLAPNPATADPEATKLALQLANLKLAEQTKLASGLALEKEALEARLKGSNADPAAATALANENQLLKNQLAAANTELQSGKGKAAKPSEVEATLRARLAVYEAHPVPYTAEEIALLKQTPPKLAQGDRKADKKAAKELPPGTAEIVAEAQRYIANKQLDKAEEKYRQVLEHDKQNVRTLVTLAALEIELDHLDAADVNIKQAVALAPNDPRGQILLGRLKTRQKDYNGAIDALNRAAKLDPKDAQTQNFLGCALNEKGLRGPAETALRKAVQMDPGYGDAHNNLAMAYITQQPPLVELARWHYKKALAAGNPANPKLERMLEEASPASSGQ